MISKVINLKKQLSVGGANVNSLINYVNGKRVNEKDFAELSAADPTFTSVNAATDYIAREGISEGASEAF
jgi:predicted double-glycine peptidase